MARSAGTTDSASAVESFARASFTHSASGFGYRITPYSVEFEKSGGPRFKKDLSFYIGSGAAARSYMIPVDGFLFEAPVAYYTKGEKWDLAPGYAQYGYPYLTRPIAPGCLGCHASFLKLVKGTQNRYADPPFAEGGVACERCHGPGDAHIAAGDGSAIVNPARLAADRRDSVCSQCHLSGEARVMKRGADWQSFQAGQRLSDIMTVFVRVESASGMTVTSHVENLAQSACKQKSGDRLWCGACHDPHAVPKASERASWFREKCESCHAGSRGCSRPPATRAKSGNDCAGCHMPKGAVTDAEHVVYTDHSIPRRARKVVAAIPPTGDLAVFGNGPSNPRDAALAYAMAGGRRAADTAPARRMLEEAMRDAPDDPEILVYLAEIYRNSGEGERARPLYQRAIQVDPGQVTARVGLGAVLFERSAYRDAIPLWQEALARNSGLALVGTNLALAQWRSGDRAGALATLRKLLDLSPGFRPASDLLAQLGK
jgi:cytochrome c-type biogenesis protein CcmH/NrfG